MKQIVIATKNKGKAAEFKRFFQTYGIEAISLLEIDDHIPDVEETGTTFKENAALKAEQISKRLNQAVLADDSGLMIDALDGKPGVYSARYAGEPTDDLANMEKVLTEMADVPGDKRSARFICMLAVATPGKDIIFQEGVCEGTIGFVQKGTNGFGYDPIFIPTGIQATMAELSESEKNKISHRSKAIEKLERWIKAL